MGPTEEPPAAGEPARHGLQQLIEERRAKAQRLRDSDAEDFPYEFPDVEPIERRARRVRAPADRRGDR